MRFAPRRVVPIIAAQRWANPRQMQHTQTQSSSMSGTTALRNFRHPLALALSLFATTVSMPAYSQGPTPGVFTHEMVQRHASELAANAYEAPPDQVAKGADNLDYDQFRQIRFRRERTIWRGDGLKFELRSCRLDGFSRHLLRSISLTAAMSAPLSNDNSYFDLGPLAGKLAPEARLGFRAFASPVR